MKLMPRWRLDFSHPGVRRVLLLMAPAAFGVSVSQISLLLNQIFASFLPTGSVSWLYYADRLMELPAGVLGVAVGTILLPSLSKYHAAANATEYSRLLDWGLRITVLLAVPSAVALAVLALPLIAMLFQYGRFSAEDAWMTRQALVAYSVGLVGMILVKILAPGFYARQNVRTPVKIGVVTLVATQLMNLVLVGPLRHAGLALAIGLGACLNALLLYLILRKTRHLRTAAGLAGVHPEGARLGGVHGGRAVHVDGRGAVVAAGGLAAQSAGDPRPGAARHRGLRRVSPRVRLPAARLLAPGGGMMGVALERFRRSSSPATTRASTSRAPA